jgi:glucose/arabinose dehydrogenase
LFFACFYSGKWQSSIFVASHSSPRRSTTIDVVFIDHEKNGGKKSSSTSRYSSISEPVANPYDFCIYNCNANVVDSGVVSGL